MIEIIELPTDIELFTNKNLFVGKLKKIASGFGWLEGPVWLESEKSLVFSDVIKNNLWSYKNNQLELIMPISHYQNGHCLDDDKNLVACSHGLRAVVVRENNEWKVLASHWQGEPLNSPNDITLHADGSLWFTDPTYGIDKAEEGYGGEMRQKGRFVYRIDKDLSLSMVIDDRHKPNGIAFLDNNNLLLADTGDGCVYLYKIKDKTAIFDRKFFQIPKGKTDGLRVDSKKNIWSSGEGVFVYDQNANLLAYLEVPEKVANLCLNDEENILYITASTSLYCIEININ